MDPFVQLFEMKIWDHVVAVVICIFAPMLAITSRKMTTEDIKLNSEEKVRLYHSNALLLFVFALIVITTWRIPGRSLAELGIDWPMWHPGIPLLLIMVVSFYAFDLYLQYGNRKRRERTLRQSPRSFAFVPKDRKEMSHFLFLAMAAGIGEEIVFRGYLIHYLVFWTGNSWWGVVIACIASSALFSFLHGYQGVISMFKIFFIALLFSAIYVFSQSLLIVILIHVSIDIISGIVSVQLQKHHPEQSE